MMKLISFFIILSVTGFFLWILFENSNDALISEKENKIIEQKIIVAFGDSLTAGQGVDAKDSYPSQLEQELHKLGYTGYKVINEGISGDTTDGGLRRIHKVLAHSPDIVILELGINDAFGGFNAQETKENLNAMIEVFLKEDIIVVLAGMKSLRRLGISVVKGFNVIYPDLAKKHDIIFISFFLDGVVSKRNLNIADGIHPNKEGYALIVQENILPVLLSIL